MIGKLNASGIFVATRSIDIFFRFDGKNFHIRQSPQEEACQIRIISFVLKTYT